MGVLAGTIPWTEEPWRATVHVVTKTHDGAHREHGRASGRPRGSLAVTLHPVPGPHYYSFVVSFEIGQSTPNSLSRLF